MSPYIRFAVPLLPEPRKRAALTQKPVKRLEISSKSQPIDLYSNAELALLVKSNSYKPVMLLDKAAKSYPQAGAG